MQRVGLWTIGIGLFLTVGLLTVEPGYAGEKEHAPTCTLATLKGRYLFADSGTLLPPAFGVTQPTPAANAGFHLFNGDGTGTDTVTVRIGAEIVLENEVVPISYTVNEDCTGSYTVLIPGGPSFGLFIAPNGEAISTIATAPPAPCGHGPSRSGAQDGAASGELARGPPDVDSLAQPVGPGVPEPTRGAHPDGAPRDGQSPCGNPTGPLRAASVPATPEAVSPPEGPAAASPRTLGNSRLRPRKRHSIRCPFSPAFRFIQRLVGVTDLSPCKRTTTCPVVL